MIAAPQFADEYRDPTTGQRVVVGSVDEDKNEIMFAVFTRYGPRVEVTTITAFFERFVRPTLPDDSEV